MVLLHVMNIHQTPNVDLTTCSLKLATRCRLKFVKVNDGEGQVILSYKRLVAEKGNKKLEEAFDNQTVITGNSKHRL